MSENTKQKYPSFPRNPISFRIVCAVSLISAGAAGLVALYFLQRTEVAALERLGVISKTPFSVQGLVARPLFWIVEELIFRGFLLQLFRRRLPLWASYLVTALLFALEHFGKGVPVMALAFCSSYYFAWLMIKTDSVYTPILAHCSFDATAIYLVCPIVAASAPLIDGHFAVSPWWSGLSGLVLVAGIFFLRCSTDFPKDETPNQAPEPTTTTVTPRAP